MAGSPALGTPYSLSAGMMAAAKAIKVRPWGFVNGLSVAIETMGQSLAG